jgi:hypothetical protein
MSPTVPTSPTAAAPSNLVINFDTDDEGVSTSNGFLSFGTYDAFGLNIFTVVPFFGPARFMETGASEGRVVIIQDPNQGDPTPNPFGGVLIFSIFGPPATVSITLYRPATGSSVVVTYIVGNAVTIPVFNDDGNEIVNIPINAVGQISLTVILAPGSVGIAALEIIRG